jgi:putative transposase
MQSSNSGYTVHLNGNDAPSSLRAEENRVFYTGKIRPSSFDLPIRSPVDTIVSTMEKSHPHRRSIRLTGYDYSQAGGYFVTLVTHQRTLLFGEVSQGKMHLSSLGKIAAEEWLRSMAVRREIQLFTDEFVVMPNHFHGIVWIQATEALPPQTTQTHKHNPDSSLEADGIRPKPGPQRTPFSLGGFIAGFKAAVTSRARRELGIQSVWQRNYYEHILRGEADWKEIYTYIQNNPTQRELDTLYPTG